MALAQHCFFFSKYSSTFTYNDLPKNITTQRGLLLPFSKTSPTRRVVKCSANSATPITSKPNDKIRRSANYKPSIWNYDFVQSLNVSDSISDTRTKDRANKLIEEVRRMIRNEDAMLFSTLELIDDIQKLGLGYHFEDDITLVLHRYSSLLKNGNKIHKFNSLHSSALTFRLLRQHGFLVSQETDIFNSFRDEEGNFKACLNKDVKGMLSLYEASYLAFQGENLLDKAREFTTIHLNNLKPEDVDKQQFEEVNYALELPLHHRMLRLQARWYIEAYSKRPDANQLLLEAAKLDFNFVQSTLQRELQEISRWWKGLDLANKLSFSRDRVMECFFWATGMVFEPQFSYPRKGLAKIAALITVIDDIYDVYGTLDELELFTNAVERWDVNAVNVLPDYMKLCFLALQNTVNDMAYDVLKKQGKNILPYVTKAWTDALKGYLQEAKWSHNKYIPKFEEYLENGWVSVSGVVLLVHAYCLTSQNITIEGLECLQNYHNLLRWPSVIFRLCNDFGTSKTELERGETATSIACIMKQTSISEESARGYLRNLVQENWIKMNRAVIINDDASTLSKPFVRTTVNLARIAQCTYQYGDGHGDPDARSIKRILSLLVDPIF